MGKVSITNKTSLENTGKEGTKEATNPKPTEHECMQH
jgi:hypothetical protein